MLLDLAPVLAMTAFHRDAPPAARRPWLLALPANYLLVAVPLLAVQATGNSAWLPDFPGLCCTLVALACLAHAPRARSHQADGSGMWSLTLTLLAAVAAALRTISLGDYLHDPHLITVSLAELLILLATVALVAPDAARAQTATPAPSPAPAHDRCLARTQDMPLQRPPRPLSLLASVLAAAGTGLTVASCSHITPLGPDPSQRMPPPSHGIAAAVPVQAVQLRSPFVLEAVRSQPATRAGGCPAGSVALSGGPGQCYRRLGTLVTVTSASVSPAAPLGPPPAQYGFVINLPAADQPALRAVTTAAADAHGYLGISVAGRTWLLPRVLQPFTGHFEITFPSRNQVLQLHRLLSPAG
ncbi:MAG TPA: hypothetical protein VGS19_14885 [Streptosporangiaceae bacterium]|nr:hypothetical protein [Streptosporangiaceae bacterium]